MFKPDSREPRNALDIILFGAPYVLLPDGSVAAFESDLALGLLAYLALNSAKPFRRVQLASFFYPNQDDKQAMQNFRQTLFRLRRAIQEDRVQAPYLMTTTDRVQFNLTSEWWMDVTAFDRAVEFTRQHQHRALESCRVCMDHLESAIAHYQGELLAGFHQLEDAAFGEWVRAKRQYYRHRAIGALHALIQHHRLFRNDQAVETYAARLEQIEPLDEISLRAAMELLARRGERNQALLMFAKFKERLHRDLDVLPEPETTRLAARTKSNQDPSPRTTLQHPNTLLTAQPLRTLSLPDTLIPFINRRAELDRLSELLTSRHDRLITIVGPSGCGKTRLALRAASSDIPAWRHGVWLALFGEETRKDAPLAVVASALGFSARRRDSLRAELLSYLHTRELLLVLDNVENAAESYDWVVRVLNNATDLTIIATALKPLGIPGENVVRLEGLGYPVGAGETTSSLEAWRAKYPAVDLFVLLAQRVRADFSLTRANAPAIARICELVEGIPLALEHAAGWVSVLTTADLAERMAQSLTLLEQSNPRLPARHSSLRAAFEYGFGRLSSATQQSLERLAHCQTPFTFDLAEQCADISLETFAELRDQSMLSPRGSRQFALFAIHRAFLLEPAAHAPLRKD